MSAEILRRAASLMRERAEKAANIAPLPWSQDDWEVKDAYTYLVSNTATLDEAEHIASWHPAVALAVAKAMEDVAQAWEIHDGYAFEEGGMPYPFEESVDGGWLAVARTYLGES